MVHCFGLNGLTQVNPMGFGLGSGSSSENNFWISTQSKIPKNLKLGSSRDVTWLGPFPTLTQKDLYSNPIRSKLI